MAHGLYFFTVFLQYCIGPVFFSELALGSVFMLVSLFWRVWSGVFIYYVVWPRVSISLEGLIINFVFILSPGLRSWGLVISMISSTVLSRSGLVCVFILRSIY